MQQIHRKNNKRAAPNPATPNPAAILPADNTQALNLMIRITDSLVNVSERESKALAQNDLLAFSILQDEKAMLADRYAAASEEFRANITRFRGTDKTLLDRLSRSQQDLGERTKNVNGVVENIYTRTQTQARAQSSLLAAQEFGQNHALLDMPITGATEEGRTSC